MVGNGKQQRQGRLLLIGLVAAVLTGGFAFLYLGYPNNGAPNNVSRNVTTQPTVQASPTAAVVATPTVVPQPTPVIELVWDYKKGEIRKSFSTVAACAIATDPVATALYPNPIYCPIFNIHFGDKVEILGPAQLFNLSGYWPLRPGWYWPVRLIEGYVAFEGGTGWVSDTAELVPSSLAQPRYRQDYYVGEVVLVSYPIYLGDDNGTKQWVKSKQRAIVLDEPTQRDDGRYWCRVRTQSGFVGSLPCVLEKVNPEEQ